jgi:hypothetical protein
MYGFMEFWGSERAEELRQEAHRGHLARDLKAAHRGEFPTPYQRVLGWLARTGRYWHGVRSSRTPSSGC